MTSTTSASSSSGEPAPISTVTSTMTAIWTPPASCTSHWTYEAQSANSVVGGLLIQDAQYQSGDDDCQPPGFIGWGRAPSFIQVFSPGVCPHGYTTANQAFNGATTVAVCCPSSFGYTSQLSTVNAGDKTADYYGCTSTFAAGAGYTTAFAANSVDGFSSELDGTVTSFTSVTGPVIMWGQPITVAFQKDDLSIFGLASTTSPSTTSSSSSSASSTSTSSGTSSSTSSTLPSTTSSASATTSASSSSSGLSGGAIAGIAIGAAAVLGILIGAALFFRGRQKKSATATAAEVPQSGGGGGGYATDKAPPLYGGHAGYSNPPYDPPFAHSHYYEAQPKTPAELPHDPSTNVVELPNHDDRRFELS